MHIVRCSEMKVTFVDQKLRRHCAELEINTAVASITAMLGNVWPVPPGCIPKLVYESKALLENDSLGSIGYFPGKCITFFYMKSPAKSAQESTPKIPCSCSDTTAPTFRSFDRVRVVGLNDWRWDWHIAGVHASPAMNGRTGVICGPFNSDTGRWTVQMDGNDSSEQTQIALLPCNLKAIQEGADQSSGSHLSLNQSAYQVLQQIHPGMNIDNRATKLLVAMLQWTMTSIASLTDHTKLNLGQLSGDPDAASILEKNPRFFAALEKLMPGELAKHASSEATKALIRASSSSSNSSAWSSAHAGLQFDPCAIVMQCVHHDVHISRCLAVAVSAATEYIAAEILELSGNVAIEKANSSRCGKKKDKRKKMKKLVIDLRGIEVAVQADSELREMFRPFRSSHAAKAVLDGSDGWVTEDDNGDNDGSVDGCDNDL
jgi:hypothetical protein